MQTVRKQSTNCTDAEPFGWGNAGNTRHSTTAERGCSQCSRIRILRFFQI